MPGQAVGCRGEAGGIAPRLGAGRGLAPLDGRAERMLERGQAGAVDRGGAEGEPRPHLGPALVVQRQELEQQRAETKAFALAASAARRSARSVTRSMRRRQAARRSASIVGKWCWTAPPDRPAARATARTLTASIPSSATTSRRARWMLGCAGGAGRPANAVGVALLAATTLAVAVVVTVADRLRRAPAAASPPGTARSR